MQHDQNWAGLLAAVEHGVTVTKAALPPIPNMTKLGAQGRVLWSGGEHRGLCLAYAWIGYMLLGGHKAGIAVQSGSAAWRLGPGEDDALGFHEEDGTFHAWLADTKRQLLIDFTASRLAKLAAAQAEVDGMPFVVTHVPPAPLVIPLGPDVTRWTERAGDWMYRVDEDYTKRAYQVHETDFFKPIVAGARAALAHLKTQQTARPQRIKIKGLRP
jgi:hypothetical protein